MCETLAMSCIQTSFDETIGVWPITGRSQNTQERSGAKCWRIMGVTRITSRDSACEAFGAELLEYELSQGKSVRDVADPSRRLFRDPISAAGLVIDANRPMIRQLPWPNIVSAVALVALEISYGYAIRSGCEGDGEDARRVVANAIAIIMVGNISVVPFAGFPFRVGAKPGDAIRSLREARKQDIAYIYLR